MDALTITELSDDNRSAQLGTRVTLKPSDMPADYQARAEEPAEDTQVTTAQ